jgi:biotin carboxyl carrier protein
MKYRVRIDDRWYEVEIIDLNTRPVKTIVDGEVIEVWPQEQALAEGSGRPPIQESPLKKQDRPSRGMLRQTVSSGGNGASAVASEGTNKVLRAPIPGVIISIAVQPEEEVVPGQELIVLEAMKMKNSIRATWAGKVAAIGVSVGQHVQHNQVLVEFTR